MINLDDSGALRAGDPGGALAEVLAYPAQWRQAAAAELPRMPSDDVHAVVVAGMGGSGISGDVAAVLAAVHGGRPVLTHKGFGLPRWAGAATLVVAASHSGATAETLSALSTALERGCPAIVVAGGGQLAELALEHDLPLVRIPSGGMPRHRIAWLAVSTLRVLGLADDLQAAAAALDEAVAAFGPQVPVGGNPAKQLAVDCLTATPLWYGAQGLAAVLAYRAKCQLNENAKLHAFANTVPELCHNEVVAWEGGGPGYGTIWLTDPAAGLPGNDDRAAALAARLTPAWTHTVSLGEGPALARFARALALLDLTSVYAALARGVDPTPIRPITELKRALETKPT